MNFSRVRFSFFTVLLLVTFVSIASSQFPSSKGPYGGQVNALLCKENGYLFAGMYANAMFRSSDNGNSWSGISNGIWINNIWSLAMSSTGHIYAGTQGVFMSTNNGDSWTQTNFPNTVAWSLTTDHDNRVFAGTDQGIYRSTDDGNSWTQVAVMNFLVNGLFVDQNNHIFAATNDSGVYRSIDHGITWSQINNGVNNLLMYAFARNSMTGELYSGGGNIFKSLNGGDTWSQLGSIPDLVRSIAVDTTKGYIYAGTESGGIYYSTDDGTSWSHLNVTPYLYYVRALQINSAYIFAGSGGKGIFRSSNKGANWSPCNEGLLASIIKSLVVGDNGNIFAGTAGNGVHRGNSSADNWIAYADSFPNPYVYALAYKPTNKYLFAGTLAGMYRSVNGGTIWSHANTGITSNTIYSIACDSTTYMYTGTYMEGIFRSSNNGDNWTKINNGLTDTTVNAIAISNHAGTKGFVYAGTEEHGVFRSSNNGDTWQQFSNGMTNLNVRELAVTDDSGFVFAGTSSGCFRSTNFGASWEKVGNHAIVYAIVIIQHDGVSGRKSVWVNSYGNLSLSTNNGRSWWDWSGGLSGKYINALAYNEADENLYVGTDGTGVFVSLGLPVELETFIANASNDGVRLSWTTATETNNYGFEIERKADGNWQSANSNWSKIGFVNGNGTSTSRHEYSFIDRNVEKGNTYQYRLKQVDVNGTYEYSHIVEIKTGDNKNEFRLEQNYPNPISQNSFQLTTINFSLNEKNHVVLKLYDVLGREVQSLIDGEKSVGRYTVQLNCSQLSGGIYFYKLSAGTISEIKQMVVTK